MQGTVKWYDPNKGYGFIEREDGQKDVFVHVTALEKAGIARLDPGQRVRFEIEDRRNNKIAAINIAVV